jgi:hypothetical protein
VAGVPQPRVLVQCGDSLDQAQLAALIGVVVAADPQHRPPRLVFTDPPYNEAFAGRVPGKFAVILNDDLPVEEYSDFARRTMAAVACLHELGATEVYVCCHWKSAPVFQRLAAWRSLIVWAKPSFGLGRGYRRQHEFILYAGAFAGTTESAVQLGRRAVLGEMDPRYVDVIRRRFTRHARATGIAPGAGALDEP